jgi:hypothetical protein
LLQSAADEPAISYSANGHHHPSIDHHHHQFFISPPPPNQTKLISPPTRGISNDLKSAIIMKTSKIPTTASSCLVLRSSDQELVLVLVNVPPTVHKPVYKYPFSNNTTYSNHPLLTHSRTKIFLTQKHTVHYNPIRTHKFDTIKTNTNPSS